MGVPFGPHTHRRSGHRWPQTTSRRLPSSPDGLLDSWKAIALYLNRDESTVQRWEKRERMPVHRHVHEKRGSVYAYRAELDAWWQGRRQRLELEKATVTAIPAETAGDVTVADAPPAGRDPWRRWWVGVAAALLLIPMGVMALNRLSFGRAASSPGGAALVRLTSTAGLDIDPALSQDGSLLAFASDRGGTGELDIWVQRLGAAGSSRGASPTSQVTNASPRFLPLTPQSCFRGTTPVAYTS